MAELEGLRRELVEFVKRTGRVSADDLVKWARERGLTMLTLYILLEESLEAGELKGGTGRQVIDEVFNLEVPSFVEATAPPQLLPQPPASRRAAQSESRRERGREKRKARVERGSLLRFFAQEGEAEKPKPEQEPQVELQGVSGERFEDASPPRDSKVQVELPAGFEELLADDNFVKAIRYLGRYWSVGKLRFLEDLESMGVQNPSRVLEELWRRGLIEVVEPGIDGAGVVNARENLLQIAKRVVQPTATQLSDVFLGEA